jgi:hypothetical protein
MGFEANAIKFLLSVSREIDLGKTLMLGRQSYQLHNHDLFSILEKYKVTRKDSEEMLSRDPIYTEPFLQHIGASEIHSIDASEYENATLVHDLNQPISSSLKEQYDTIIDAGTLEHIFNFPAAIKNCMEMLKVNGHFISITITNNFSGHGFYQFSPELFYRIFSPENGFETKKMYLAVSGLSDYWYEIPDPKQIKKRVLFENSKQSFLLILAKKIASKEIFQTTPQQSDYEHLAWEGKEQFPVEKKKLFSKLFFMIPDHQKQKIRSKLRILDAKAWKEFLRDTGSGKKNELRKVKNI